MRFWIQLGTAQLMRFSQSKVRLPQSAGWRRWPIRQFSGAPSHGALVAHRLSMPTNCAGPLFYPLAALCTLLSLGCSSSSGDGTTTVVDAGDVGTVVGTGINPSHFLAKALVAGTTITTESCTLSGGTATTCYRISLTGAPADHAVGPFCPRTTTDGADTTGIWIDKGKVYNVTGSFVTNLATFYGDSTWQLFDASTGKVRVTDTQAACEAAARPDVDPKYNNYCVECAISYVGGGRTATYLCQLHPSRLLAPQKLAVWAISVWPSMA